MTTSDDDPLKSQSALDRVATAVLLLVNVGLVWMLIAAMQPTWLRLPSLQLEVLAMLGLLTGALLLVSAVALRQTRS
jgi:hypothetical protein